MGSSLNSGPFFGSVCTGCRLPKRDPTLGNSTFYSCINMLFYFCDMHLGSFLCGGGGGGGGVEGGPDPNGPYYWSAFGVASGCGRQAVEGSLVCLRA